VSEQRVMLFVEHTRRKRVSTGITLLVTLLILPRTLDLLNSVLGVILVICALHLPFALFVMKRFFDGIPRDIHLSALIDGASRLRAWSRVLLPQARNGAGAVAMFSFLWGWTNCVYVLAIGGRLL
jgi:inositol-phosphate transport system permease protein